MNPWIITIAGTGTNFPRRYKFARAAGVRFSKVKMSLNLQQIDNYISSLIENAEQLIHESKILFDANSFARSHTLSHLAREELSKCIILYGAGRRIQGGDDIDWKNTMKRLRDHKSKIRQETVKMAMISSGAGNKEMTDFMINNIDHFATHKNNQKNISIYVGLNENGEITLPSREINKEKAQRTLSLAELALRDEKKIYEALGKLSDVEPGSLSSAPTVSTDISDEEFESHMKDMGDLYNKVLEHLHKDESNK